VTDAVGQLAAFMRERKSDPCPGLLVVGLEFGEPRLHTGQQVRFVAMGTTEWSDVTRQRGEALHVQINAGVDLVSGCWANKSQRRHYKTLHASEFAFGNGQKKKPRPGETGASFGSFGGNVYGEKLPSRRRLIRLMRSVQILFPYEVNKKKLFCPQPLLPLEKRSIAYLGAPATSTLTSNAATQRTATWRAHR
jgi:hypothetical protein